MKSIFYSALLVLLFITAPVSAYNSYDLATLLNTGSCTYGDLSGAELSNLDLTGADLTGSNLTGARLVTT